MYHMAGHMTVILNWEYTCDWSEDWNEDLLVETHR